MTKFANAAYLECIRAAIGRNSALQAAAGNARDTALATALMDEKTPTPPCRNCRRA